MHGFLEKNRDDLPSQLRKLVESSKIPFLNMLYPPLSVRCLLETMACQELIHAVGTPLTSLGGVLSLPQNFTKAKASGRGGTTIAKTFLSDLGQLTRHLQKTNPHYVRCIKPNDFKARPIDGSICFDAGKTHKQLLYAGVKKICDIRKQGFPFRETFKLFWERCIRNEYHLWQVTDTILFRCRWCKKGAFFSPQLRLIVHFFRRTNPPIDPSQVDAKEGCRLLCEQALPTFDANADPRAAVDGADPDAKPPFWLLGNTMVLGKDRTLSELAKWHSNLIMPMINRWVCFMSWMAVVLRQLQYVCCLRWRMLTHRLRNLAGPLLSGKLFNGPCAGCSSCFG